MEYLGKKKFQDMNVLHMFMYPPVETLVLVTELVLILIALPGRGHAAAVTVS